MSQNNDILALLKDVLDKASSIEKNATDRHTYYSKNVEEHKKTTASLAKDITELKAFIKDKTAEIDKRISINELTFKNFKSEIKKEINITRWAGVVLGSFLLLCMGIQVSWYAKQPPQDVNPLAISRDVSKNITKLR